MTGLWLASHIVLWVFCIFVTLLVIGLYRQIGELSISPSRRTAMMQGLQVGDEAPSFSLTSSEGLEVSFPAAGAPSLLVFGDADCPPCNTLADELNKLAPASVRILFVSGDDSAENRRFAAEHHVTYPVLNDPGSATSKVYKVRNTPFVYVVDEEGVVRAKGIANSVVTVSELLADGLGKSWTLEPTG